MRLLLCLAMLVPSAVSAQAACFLAPDTAQSRYVENNTAYMLCLQRELATSTAQSNALRLQQGEFDLSLTQLRRAHQFQLQSLQLAAD